MKKFLFIIPYTLLLFCQSEKTTLEEYTPTPLINVKHDSTLSTNYYSLTDSSGTYTFEVFLSDLNKGIFRYRYDGQNGLKEQTRLMRQLLNHISADSSLNIEFTTLYWGSLTRSEKHDFIMAERLALAASSSASWNKISGKPLKGHENLFVQNIANSQNIYPELKALFTQLGYKIEVSGVEKVFIKQASKLPFWNSISGQVDSTDRLPYDCQTWFKVEKETL